LALFTMPALFALLPSEEEEDEEEEEKLLTPRPYGGDTVLRSASAGGFSSAAAVSLSLAAFAVSPGRLSAAFGAATKEGGKTWTLPGSPPLTTCSSSSASS
jgi:hypothetical protein